METKCNIKSLEETSVKLDTDVGGGTGRELVLTKE